MKGCIIYDLPPESESCVHFTGIVGHPQTTGARNKDANVLGYHPFAHYSSPVTAARSISAYSSFMFSGPVILTLQPKPNTQL